ncbi:MAG TPA: hypothetical protein VG028_03540 [Terriglobia bacterium]|nr:hypothetical protein [Terriglobia bacterium]
MNCTVCEKQLGFWAKLSTGSDHVVCKECQATAMNLLQHLIKSVGEAQYWKQEYARRWVAQFEGSVRDYHVPASVVEPLRFKLLNNIFRLIAAENEIPDSDIVLLNELAEKYKLGESSTPEVRDTLIRIVLHQAIQSWERGTITNKQCNGLVLQEDENCHWEEVAALRVQKTKREYVGGYSSISVPIVKGVRLRVGGFKGTAIGKELLEDKGNGVLHITSQRVCFTGEQLSVAIPFKKMISMGGFEEGFIVQTSNEKKPGIFIVRHPELTVQLVMLATARHEENDVPRRVRKKLPLTKGSIRQSRDKI